MPRRPPQMLRRWGVLGLVAVMACAGIGYVVGLTDGVPRSLPDRPPPAQVDDDSGDVLPARNYADLRKQRIGANRGFANKVDDLEPEVPAPPESIDTQAKEQSLLQRSQERAYDGAPPVIPHVVEQRSSDACRSCHKVGVQIGEVMAGRIPHFEMTECQQCHVAASPLEQTVVLTTSLFEGSRAPAEGDRAWPGAPPVIPHATWMRDNCLACHGPTGRAGLQTTHPERVNCTQCHAPSAQLNQAPFGPARFLRDLEESGFD